MNKKLRLLMDGLRIPKMEAGRIVAPTVMVIRHSELSFVAAMKVYNGDTGIGANIDDLGWDRLPDAFDLVGDGFRIGFVKSQQKPKKYRGNIVGYRYQSVHETGGEILVISIWSKPRPKVVKNSPGKKIRHVR